MFFLDTNALINLDLNNFDFGGKFVISSESLKELENIKMSYHKDYDVKKSARDAVKFLEKALYEVIVTSDVHFSTLEKFGLRDNADNLIVASAYLAAQSDKIEFLSYDLLCRNIAKNIFGLNTVDLIEKEEIIYTGYKEIAMSDEEMAEFYNDLSCNKYNILINEYILITNKRQEIVDKLKWNGEKFITLKYRQISNDFTGKIKPRNLQQELAFDLLQDDSVEIKLLLGKFGSGKTYLMVSHAIQLLKSKKYDKIMWVRNNIEVKNSKEIGFLPGKKTDKLMCYAMPMADHCGGVYGLEMFINNGEVELEHLGHIRGRDIKNTIIISSEAENMTKEHIQLLIGRIGEGSALWLDGDLKQIDSKAFEENNGISALIDKLKGNKHFGFVKLQKTERSEVADLADLLD